MLSLSLLWQSLQATFGDERMAGAVMDVRFVKPVREDDLVIAGGQRAEREPAYEVWVRAEGANRSETVISGTVSFDASAASTARTSSEHTIADTRQGNPS
jgi:hypothetical protein